MDKKRLETIKAQLNRLGFDDQVEERLLVESCFSKSAFDVRFSKRVGEDVCTFSVRVEGDIVVSYTAVLRKGLVVPPLARALADRVASVDWDAVVSYRMGLADSIEMDVLVAASSILQDLAKAAEGGLILYKYRAGSSLESLVPGLASFKSRYEISQRFYVSPDQPPITSDEAMRFLQNNWTQRQMQQSRLQQRQVEGGNNTAPSKKARKKVVRKK